MLKIEKINKSDLDIKVAGQACIDGCMYDCERVNWVGNRSQEVSGCFKVVTCDPYISTLMWANKLVFTVEWLFAIGRQFLIAFLNNELKNNQWSSYGGYFEEDMRKMAMFRL